MRREGAVARRGRAWRGGSEERRDGEERWELLTLNGTLRGAKGEERSDEWRVVRY